MGGIIIRTFLIEGLPEGLRTLELSNTTVKGTIFPRPSLERFLERDEADRPGIYILIGPDGEKEATDRVYVGEGDPVGPRLRSHAVNKDFWTQVLVFTSKDDYLTKTQIQFLEAKLVADVVAASRVTLDNGNQPALPKISEADKAEVEGFLSSVRLLVGVAGHTFLRSHEAPAVHAHKDDMFVYEVKKTAKAIMVRSSTGYVVRRGSTAMVEAPDYAKNVRQNWVRNLREELLRGGVLVKKSDELRTIASFSPPFDHEAFPPSFTLLPPLVQAAETSA